MVLNTDGLELILDGDVVEKVDIFVHFPEEKDGH